MKKILIKSALLLFTCITLPFSTFSLPDSGVIEGTVTDLITGESLPGATVSYYDQGNLKGMYADDNGKYKIKPLSPGNYEITFSFTGYQKIIKKEVVVTSGGITFLNVALSNDNTLPWVEISTFAEPIIRKDFTGGITKILQQDIKVSIARDIRELVAQTAAVYQKKEGGSINIRGSRENATQYIIDGVKMLGGFSIPKSAIQEITVITGGVPAMYGDATGGIVVITTKSAFNH